MPALRSAGFVIFRATPHGRRYLVLRASRAASTVAPGKTVKEFWDFPKGELEPGEQAKDAARREAGEEAGFHDMRAVEGFKETAQYFSQRDGKPILKFVAMFLAEAAQEKVALSWEHDRYAWLAYPEAHERVTLLPMKRILERAEGFLNRI